MMKAVEPITIVFKDLEGTLSTDVKLYASQDITYKTAGPGLYDTDIPFLKLSRNKAGEMLIEVLQPVLILDKGIMKWAAKRGLKDLKLKDAVDMLKE
jgi:hypothetical protein